MTMLHLLNLFSTAANQLRIDDVQHKDWNASSPLGYQVTHSMDAILLGQEMYTVQFDLDVLATGPYLKSVQVLFKHSLPLTTFGWTIASLLHPLGQQSYDMNSQYYFLPGHYVEIHYTPLQVNQISQTDNTTSLFQRFLVFMGYGERETYYTYQSTAMVTPFSPGSYDNVTTIIIIRPTSNIEILTTAEEKVSFRETLSNIGGLIGIVGSVIVFLFGASLMSPWGFIAEIPYFRNRISTSMSDAYKTKNGLFNGPFTTKVGQVGKFDNKLSVDERTILLKERIDELELILCEYYLNGAVFVAYSHPPVTMSPEPSTEGQTLPEQGQQPPPETEGQTPSEQGKQPPLKTEERRPLLGTEGQTPSKQE
ncbi:hypothetical protein EDD21DRAFT_408471 [Dissophora ornata]|nr:hypothetical protein EDD21DRAFT_408471 [Dissophora ornata]